MSDIFNFTEQELKNLTEAGEIESQIQVLGNKIDTMLDPICRRILTLPQNKLKEQLPALIEKFPRGFHRSELRAMLQQLEGIRTL